MLAHSLAASVVPAGSRWFPVSAHVGPDPDRSTVAPAQGPDPSRSVAVAASGPDPERSTATVVAA